MNHIRTEDVISGALRLDCRTDDPSLCLYVDGRTSVVCSGEPREVHELARLYKLNRYDFVMTFIDYLKGEGLVARTGRVPRHISHHLGGAGRN